MNRPSDRTSRWPRISIVTPSFNQGRYLERTILSVIGQNYPDLEYIVMDGGSDDGSVEIIRKHENHLAHWQSGKDRGQADAIYRGFERAAGDLLGWINSDDYYLPGTLHAIGEAFRGNPGAEMFVAGTLFRREGGADTWKYYPFVQDFRSLLCAGMLFGQMACFWSRRAFFETGGFDRDLRFCFDYDMFLRLARRQRPVAVDRIGAVHRMHGETKTATIYHTVGLEEIDSVRKRFGIDTIPDDERDRIRTVTRSRFRASNRRGFLLDAFRDPLFFLRSAPFRVRDWLRSSRTERGRALL